MTQRKSHVQSWTKAVEEGLKLVSNHIRYRSLKQNCLTAGASPGTWLTDLIAL